MKRFFYKVILIVFAFAAAFTLASCAKNAEKRNVVNDEAAVAELTIHTFDGAYGSLPLVPNFGHSFISVKNISESDITVGKFVLPAGEEVTLGGWAASGHVGTWYNLEAVYYDLGKYDTVKSLSKNIGAESLLNANKHIVDNDRWEFFYNCTAFATEVWNAAANGDEIIFDNLPTPNALKDKIGEFKNAAGVKKLVNYSAVGYFDGDEFISYTYVDAAS
jgi:hypothetical protein